MEVYTGTSGYAYPEWRGTVYPPDLGNEEMLGYYARRFRAVEINNTFYRMPRRAVVRQWASQTPEDFRIVIKATRRITHVARLKKTAELQTFLVQSLEELAERRGPVLFQLPPSMRKDVERLRAFLDGWPAAIEASFELPHPSWQDPEVLELMSERGVAWCSTDRAGEGLPELHPMAPFGSLRLRGADYPEAVLRELLGRLEQTGWEQAYVFFKQPLAAHALQEMVAPAELQPHLAPEVWAETESFRAWLDEKIGD